MSLISIELAVITVRYDNVVLTKETAELWENDVAKTKSDRVKNKQSEVENSFQNHFIWR